MSTNETTPFVVRIYNNGVLYKTATISKGDAKTVSIDRDVIITGLKTELFKPIKKGLFISGERKFFATLKVMIYDVDLMEGSSEIVNSKGQTGLGTSFLLTPVNISSKNDRFNFQSSVIATQDDTTITVSGYQSTVRFADGTTKPTGFTFTLNKGESYIISGNLDENAPNVNRDGFIGAQLTSNKPVAVFSGNFLTNADWENSGIATDQGDIFLEQMIPISKLGKEFALIRGNGSGPKDQASEAAYIIATEDNTTITVFGPSSTDALTMNKGEYWIADAYYYSPQGSNVYTMGIKATKNVYVHQVELGSGPTSGANNLVPALECFIPNKIDEISNIDQVGHFYPLSRLNLTVQKDANVFVNGTKLGASNGPYPILGIPDWEIYVVKEIRGTIEIDSDKSVLASVIAGDEGYGYASYYSGYETSPQITKTGDCFTSVRLEVTGSYDHYQWYYNTTLLPSENGSILYPNKYGIGTYYCMVTKTGCGTRKSEDFYFSEICPSMTDVIYTIGTCSTLVITPTFSTSPNPIDSSKTKITLAPSFGSLIIQSDGFLVYKPNVSSELYQDHFAYSIENAVGNYEMFNMFVNIIAVVPIHQKVFKCRDKNGNVSFDLTSINTSIEPTDSKEYYRSKTDAETQTNPITNFNNYTDTGIIHVRITSKYGCVDYATIDLSASLTLDIRKTNFEYCRIGTSGITLKLNVLIEQIAVNYALFDYKFYNNEVDALDGTKEGLPNDFTYNAPTSLYLRAWFYTCIPYVVKINFDFKSPISLNSVAPQELCYKIAQDGVNINSYSNWFTTDPDVSVSFHATETDAENNVDPLSGIQKFETNTTFYLRASDSFDCATIGKLEFLVKAPTYSSVLKDISICQNAQTNLDAGFGFDSYLWSNGSTSSSIIVGVGEYYVDLESAGCITRQHVKVTAFSQLTITKIDIQGNTVAVEVSGGIPPYLYSLNGSLYQTSNVFSGLQNGMHNIKVIDTNNCDFAERNFSIFSFTNVITPNRDGLNDTIDFSELLLKEVPSVSIYNRFGIKVFEGSKANNFIWNGKDISQSILPTGSYWSVLQWQEVGVPEKVIHTEWIFLKNR